MACIAAKNTTSTTTKMKSMPPVKAYMPSLAPNLYVVFTRHPRRKRNFYAIPWAWPTVEWGTTTADRRVGDEVAISRRSEVVSIRPLRGLFNHRGWGAPRR